MAKSLEKPKPKVINAIKDLLDYVGEDEMESAQESFYENGEVSPNHIFHKILIISNWLYNNDKKIEYYIDVSEVDHN